MIFFQSYKIKGLALFGFYTLLASNSKFVLKRSNDDTKFIMFNGCNMDFYLRFNKIYFERMISYENK